MHHAGKPPCKCLLSVKRSIASTMPELSVGSSDSFVEMMDGISLVSGWFSYAVSAIALAGRCFSS